ncbi:MAG: transcriptional repressor [Elusimicrobiales bacterium]|jgi:Fur family ferric uptake transcriptional regulator|nr:transcriptional repressor [Elusimicrobiales bacterium]NLH39310.1 transcriptional repressor [Elusimicrobiota bacterium]
MKKYGYEYSCCKKEGLRRCFNHCGGRITKPRELILDFFHRKNGHFTADEVFNEIVNSDIRLGIATVYRTINSLVKSGVLNKFDFGDGKAKYELSDSHNGKMHHHHLVCNRCGKIVEYSDLIDDEKILFDKLQNILSKKYGFDIKGHTLHFYGLCPKCKNKA